MLLKSFDTATVGFLAGILASAFGAGMGFMAWRDALPTKEDIKAANKVAELALENSKQSRVTANGCNSQLSVLRRSVAGGVAKSIASPRPNGRREEARRAAVLRYRLLLGQGWTQEDALEQVIEEAY